VGLVGQVSGDRSSGDDRHSDQQFTVSGKQEAQREQDSEHPLADRPGRQYFVHQQGGTLHLAAGAAAGVEATSLAGEGQLILLSQRPCASRALSGHTSGYR
jgi:hypothetical protein